PSSIFSLHRFATSSSKAHCPVFAQLPQAIQPRTGFFPSCRISVSTPFLFSSFATSLSAVNVQPASWGLPFNNTSFISVLLLTFFLFLFYPTFPAHARNRCIRSGF